MTETNAMSMRCCYDFVVCCPLRLLQVQLLLLLLLLFIISEADTSPSSNRRRWRALESQSSEGFRKLLRLSSSKFFLGNLLNKKKLRNYLTPLNLRLMKTKTTILPGVNRQYTVLSARLGWVLRFLHPQLLFE
jgi:hypothetical protein